MAPLNPSVPQVQDPNYIYWSREIQQPEADKSGQYSWTSAGQALEAGAKGAFETVKNNIAQTLDQKLSPVIQGETDRLKSVYDHITGNQPDLPDWAKVNQSGNLPDGLQRLPQQLDTLQSRRANGAISETHYIGQVLQISKDFQNTYDAPAFKDYIVDQVHRITGIRNANAEIQSLVQDINSFASSKDSTKNHILNELASSGYPGSEEIIKQVRNGQRDEYSALRWYNSQKGPDVLAKQLETQLRLQNLTEEQQAKSAITPAGIRMHSTVLNSINNVFATHVPDPNNPGGFKDMNINELIDNQMISNGFHPSDQQWQGLSRSAQAALLQADRQIDLYLDSPSEVPNKTWREVLGTSQAETLKQNNLSYLKTLNERISKKDEGFMYDSIDHANSMKRDAIGTLYKQPDLRRQADILSFGQWAGGPNSFVWSQDFINSHLKGMPSIQKDLKDGLYEMLGQPDAELRPTVSGPPNRTFSQHVNGVVNPVGPPLPPEQKKAAAAALAEEPAALFASVRSGKQKDQAAINMGRAVFGDPNSLFNFQASQTREVTRPDGVIVPRRIKGTTEYFQEWASPEVQKQMHGYGPEMWNMTRNWIDQTGSRLFKNDFGEVGKQLQRFPDVKIAWDKDNQKLIAYADPKPLRKGEIPDTMGPYNRASTIQTHYLDNLTGVFKVWAATAKEEGQDPNAYILSTMRRNGIELNQVQPLANAIKNSAMKDKPE